MMRFSGSQLKAILVVTAALLGLSLFRYFSVEPVEASVARIETRPETSGKYQGIYLIDVNQAPADSLELIPGIGPVLAARIVAHRDSTGGFVNLDELLEVRGIGERLLEKIRPFVRIDTR